MPFPSPALVLPFYVLLKIGLSIRRWRVQAALEGIAQLCVDEALALRRPRVIDAGRHSALALPLAPLTARRPTAAIPADLPKQDRVASVQGVARFATNAHAARCRSLLRVGVRGVSRIPEAASTRAITTASTAAWLLVA
jgi:hypothetical protein